MSSQFPATAWACASVTAASGEEPPAGRRPARRGSRLPPSMPAIRRCSAAGPPRRERSAGPCPGDDAHGRGGPAFGRAPPAAIRYAAVLSSLSGHMPSAASACLRKPRASRSSLRCKWTKASATSAGASGHWPRRSKGRGPASVTARTSHRAGLPPAPGVRPARVPRAPDHVCPRVPALSGGGEPPPPDSRTTVLRWPGQTARSSRALDAGPASPPGPGRASAGHCRPPPRLAPGLPREGRR